MQAVSPQTFAGRCYRALLSGISTGAATGYFFRRFYPALLRALLPGISSGASAGAATWHFFRRCYRGFLPALLRGENLLFPGKAETVP